MTPVLRDAFLGADLNTKTETSETSATPNENSFQIAATTHLQLRKKLGRPLDDLTFVTFF